MGLSNSDSESSGNAVQIARQSRPEFSRKQHCAEESKGGARKVVGCQHYAQNSSIKCCIVGQQHRPFTKARSNARPDYSKVRSSFLCLGTDAVHAKKLVGGALRTNERVEGLPWVLSGAMRNSNRDSRVRSIAGGFKINSGNGGCGFEGWEC